MKSISQVTLQLAIYSAIIFGLLINNNLFAHQQVSAEPTHWIRVFAPTKEQRSNLANQGLALEGISGDWVDLVGSNDTVRTIQALGFKSEVQPLKHDNDSIEQFESAINYKSYAEVNARLEQLRRNHPKLASLFSMGNSVEGRAIPTLRISGQNLTKAHRNNLPVILFTGCHHAREHLSVQIPLMLADYLLSNYGINSDVTRLVDSREIYIAPIINPDGYVYDYRDNQGNGRYWRKNRRTNGDGTFGVDLNRNYGFEWGTGGSSKTPSSDTYMGSEPFSEPESKAVRDFVKTQPRMKSLLTFHTFSELILYPWGHTFDAVGDNGKGRHEDRLVFEKMARDMAAWNHYTPQQSSDLYIASGDTTDWAYGERGIFGFTFELSPGDFNSGGFYPEPSIIEPTFNANIKPMLYMIEFADDPTRVLREKTPSFLVTPSSMGVPIASSLDLWR